MWRIPPAIGGVQFLGRQTKKNETYLNPICVKQPMAFQPRFEHAYGFSFLDELHNFFPELLYDTHIFDHAPVNWMRHRMQTLFPAVFARNTHLYGIYQQTQRRQAFQEWIARQNPPQPPVEPTLTQTPTPPVSTTPVTAPPVTTPVTAPTPPATTEQPAVETQIQVRTIPLVQSDHLIHTLLAGMMNSVRSGEIRPPIVSRAAQSSATNETDDDNIIVPASVITPLAPSRIPSAMPSLIHRLNQRQRPAFPPANLMSTLLNFAEELDVGGTVLWPDVQVSPTLEQIEAGSEFVDPIDIPVETVCAVCMEHDRRGEFNTPWRRLDCNHEFHQPCIDQWYNQSVYCPVCRHDIREPI